ncbi:PREDICTED: neurturin [Myotis brandtii]|uniref:neurturin n=1 Tax=Myotis brandtii TaxID=109478 RepID=UPI000703F74F|nr:PREDICTED: neurturin [Myotis brandtii]
MCPSRARAGEEPTTMVHALDRNRTRHPSVHRPMLYPPGGLQPGPRMQRWKAAALASVLCSSVLSIWMCRDGLLLSHRLGPALAPLRRPPRTLDARIARLAQSTATVRTLRATLDRQGYWQRRASTYLELNKRSGRARLRAWACLLSEACCGNRHSQGSRQSLPLRLPSKILFDSQAYEDEVSFLDTNSRYHTVHELSARECACV